MMIQINLLPASYRKPEASSMGLFVRSPLSLLVLAVMVGVVALLLGVTQIRQLQLAHVQTRLSRVAPKKAAVESLAQSVQALRDEKAALEHVLQSRSQWARHLNLLSNVTPEGVWFTDLLVDADKGLVIQGSAIGRDGAEMVQIGRMAQDLKADPVFSATVHDVQIQSIESVQDHETEVVRFTLTGVLTSSGSSGP